MGRLITGVLMSQDIYQFTVKNNKGEDVSLSQFRGKVLLIVNTAAKCGFTPQYNDLDELYDKYGPQGLEILDFPCNQYGGQAPGSDEEIQEFCTLRFSTKFPRFQKIDVNGENAIPLYQWLKAQADVKKFSLKHPLMSLVTIMASKANKQSTGDNDIRWNFTKFLVSADGEVLGRFEPAVTGKDLEPSIQKALSK